MDKLEMIEKLRERADISYEEAKEILDRAEGDLLEAIVLLEKEGRMRQPQAEAAAETAAQEANAASETKASADAAVPAEAQPKEKKPSGLSKAIRNFFDFLTQTSFHVTRKGSEIFAMPSLVFAGLLFFFWEPIIPVMIIALFFDVRYRFTGQKNTDAANDILDKAGSFVDGIESGIQSEA